MCPHQHKCHCLSLSPIGTTSTIPCISSLLIWYFLELSQIHLHIHISTHSSSRH
uniref:Uncharacterized protein n=1 Tax=Rhizophora mucronata TaxID=61149 RepID=A0A2P2PFB6_RHIMU